jgi:putative flippase GtrA
VHRPRRPLSMRRKVSYSFAAFTRLSLENPMKPEARSTIAKPRDRKSAKDVFGTIGRIYISWQFVYFIVFGGIAAITNLFIGYLLYSSPGKLPYWLAVFTGASSGLIVNFSLNYRFNFRFRGRSIGAQFRTFCIVSAFGIIITTIISILLRRIFIYASLGIILSSRGIPITENFLANFCSVGLVTFYSFVAHKYLTFSIGVRERWRYVTGSLNRPETG